MTTADMGPAGVGLSSSVSNLCVAGGRESIDKSGHGEDISIETNNMKTDAQLNFEYATTTSCHGWAKVARAKRTWEKVAWVIIVLVCVANLFPQAGLNLESFLRNPIQSQFGIDVSRPFFQN